MSPQNETLPIPGTNLPMVELLPMSSEHVDMVHSWITDERARPWLDLGGGRQTLSKRELYLLLTGSRSHTRLVRIPGSTEIHGLVCLGDVTNLMKSADVWGVRGSYTSGPAQASVAAFLLVLANGFLDLDRQVIGSWIVDGNQFSIVMHQRLGLKETGRQRGRHVSNGLRSDRLLYDITREEFAQRFPHVPSESGRTFATMHTTASKQSAASDAAAGQESIHA